MNVQAAELEDARKGTLYFLSKLEVERRPSFDIGLVSNFVSGTSILSDLKNVSSDLVKRSETGRKVIEGIDRFTKPIKDSLASFFDYLAETHGDDVRRSQRGPGVGRRVRSLGSLNAGGFIG